MAEAGEWPSLDDDEAARAEVFKEAEYWLRTGGQTCYLARFDDDETRGNRVEGALGPALCELLDHVERPTLGGGPRMSRQRASELWALVRSRTLELSRLGRLPRGLADADAVTGWPRVELLCRLLAESMQYSSQKLEHRSPSGLLKSARAMAWNLTQMIDSLAGQDVVVARALRGHLVQANCRVFADSIQLLFVAGKVATGGCERQWVVTVHGTAGAGPGIDHVWNWFMDADSDTLVPFDLSAGSETKSRGLADEVLNPRFEASRRHNTSGFLSTLLMQMEEGPSYARRATLTKRVLADAVEPATAPGAMLLYELLRKGIWDRRAGTRVVRWLEEHTYDRVSPRWRVDLEQHRPKTRLQSALQHEILDLLGIPA